MLFESRRILIGFRLKITFEEFLKIENSYVYVNVFKTSTVGELLNDMKNRFNLPNEIFLVLDNCRLLESEDIFVLADVTSEVKVVSVNEASSNFPEQHPICEASSSNNRTKTIIETDTRNNVKYSLANNISDLVSEFEKDYSVNSCDERKTNNICKPLDINKLPDDQIGRIPGKKCLYSSIAETIKLITQDRSDSFSNENESTFSIMGQQRLEDRKNIENVEEEKNENFKECRNDKINDKSNIFDNNSSINDSNEEYLTIKKKRKRKRKHSKRREGDDKLITKTNGSTDCAAGTGISRKHVFFNDDEFCGESSNEKMSNLFKSKYNNVSSVDFMTKSNNLNYSENRTSNYCDELKNANDSPIVLVSKKSSSDGSEHSINTNQNDEHKKNDSTVVLVDRKPSLFKSEQRVISNNPNDEHKQIPLSTLLMCKQLKTCLEYNVQYVGDLKENFKYDKNYSRVNESNLSANEITIDECDMKNNSLKQRNVNDDYKYYVKDNLFENVVHNSEKTENFSELKKDVTTSRSDKISQDNNDCQLDNNDSENDCKIISQYKVDGDIIRLCHPDGSWEILTNEICNRFLSLVQEPKENQAITFQILYLSQKMCPKMSNLMCGTVIRFSAQSKKLIVNILRGFIDTLVADFDETMTLPEEILWIVDDVYEINWLSVKNPRLLI